MGLLYGQATRLSNLGIVPFFGVVHFFYTGGYFIGHLVIFSPLLIQITILSFLFISLKAMPDAGHLPPCGLFFECACRTATVPAASERVFSSPDSLPPPPCAIVLTLSTSVIIGVYNCSGVSRGGALVKVSDDRGRLRLAPW